MPTLKFNPPYTDSSNQSDVERIVEVCAKLDHTISLADARLAWQAHSDMSSASWLYLPDSDDVLFSIVSGHCTTED